MALAQWLTASSADKNLKLTPLTRCRMDSIWAPLRPTTRHVGKRGALGFGGYMPSKIRSSSAIGLPNSSSMRCSARTDTSPVSLSLRRVVTCSMTRSVMASTSCSKMPPSVASKVGGAIGSGAGSGGLAATTFLRSVRILSAATRASLMRDLWLKTRWSVTLPRRS